jgi:hypothetical protein
MQSCLNARLAIARMPGVGLEGGQEVRPALQKQPLGGGPVPSLLVEECQVEVGARQVVAPVGLVGEAGRRGGPGEFPRPQFPWPSSYSFEEKPRRWPYTRNIAVRGPSPECWPDWAWRPLRTDRENRVDDSDSIHGGVARG